jgi:hypothetical protein
MHSAQQIGLILLISLLKIMKYKYLANTVITNNNKINNR